MRHKILLKTTFSKIAVLFVSLLLPLQVLAWSVNTHHGITKIAAEKAENLQSFLKDFGLDDWLTNENPGKQYPIPCMLNLYSASMSFIQAANALEIEARRPTIDTCTATSLIAAGSILEDDYERWLRHFYNPIDNSGLSGFDSALEWAFDSETDALTRDNHYSWNVALNEFSTAAMVGATPIQRMEGKQRFFTMLGYVSHLLEDMSQPLHTRDDAHPTKAGKRLEVYGSEFLTYQVLSSYYENGIMSDQFVPTFSRAIRYFEGLAEFSNWEFFSDETIFSPNFPSPNDDPNFRFTFTTGNNQEQILNIPVNTALEEQIVLKIPRVVFTPIAGSIIPIQTGEWIEVRNEFVISNSLQEIYDFNWLFTGKTNNRPRLARSITTGLDDNITRCGRLRNGFSNDIDDMPFEEEFNCALQDPMNLVIRDNALVLIPKAVAYVRGLLNHFFRGRLQASLVGNELIITNSSTDPFDVFGIGGSLSVHYEDINTGNMTQIIGLNLGIDVPVGQSISFDNFDDKPEYKRIIVLYDGIIGAERGVAATIVKQSTTLPTPNPLPCNPTVVSVSPLSATFEQPTTFTVQGNCLSDTTAFWIGECANLVSQGGDSQTRYFACTPSYTTGVKTGVVKEQAGGIELYNFTVNVQATASNPPSPTPNACTPYVNSVSPLSVTFEQPTTFTVQGGCLPDTTAFWIGECANLVSQGGDSQTRYFACTPSYTTGVKAGVVKNQVNGLELYNFTVNVQAPVTNSPSSPTIGASCGTGKVYDCALNCVNASNTIDWQGDGSCDNGEYGVVLTCPAFNNDGGDCNTPAPTTTTPTPGASCGTGSVYDCALNCFSSADVNAWKVDSYCDDGTYGAVLTCPAFNNDNGACTSAPPQASEVMLQEPQASQISGGSGFGVYCFGSPEFWHQQFVGNNGSIYTLNNDASRGVNNYCDYNFEGLTPGNYEVQVWIPPENATTYNACYKVSDMWGTDNFISVPQIHYYDVWVSLGVFATNASGQLNVTLSDLTMEPHATTAIGFDAIKVIPAFNSPAQSKSECSLNGW